MNTKSPPVSPRGQNPIQRPAVTQKLPPSGKPDKHKSPVTNQDNPFHVSNFKEGSAEEPCTLDKAASKVREKGHRAKEKVKEKSNKLLEKTGSAVEMLWGAGKTVVDGAANIATQITNDFIPDVFTPEDKSAQTYRIITEYNNPIQPEFSYAPEQKIKEAYQNITGEEKNKEAPAWPLASEAIPITPVYTYIIPKTPQYSSRFLGLIDSLIDVGNKIDNKFLGDKVPDTTVDRIKVGIWQFTGFFKKEAPVALPEELDEEAKIIEKLAQKAIHALTGLKPEQVVNPDGSIGHQFAFDKQDLHTAFEHIAALNTLDPKLGSDLIRLAGDFVKGIFEDEKPQKKDGPAKPLTDSAPQIIEALTDSMFENRIRQLV